MEPLRSGPYLFQTQTHSRSTPASDASIADEELALESIAPQNSNGRTYFVPTLVQTVNEKGEVTEQIVHVNAELKKSPASGDLSAQIDESASFLKKEDELLLKVYKLVNEELFADAVSTLKELQITDHKIDAIDHILKECLVKVRASKGEEKLRISSYVKEILSLIPQQSQTFLFGFGCDLVAQTKASLRFLYTNNFNRLIKRNAPEDIFFEIFNLFLPLMHRGIGQILEIYKLLDNDSSRCALLTCLFGNIFEFPEVAFTRLPDAAITRAVRSKDETEINDYKRRRTEHARKCEEFKAAFILNNKNKIMEEIVQHHAGERNFKSLIFVLKNMMDKDKWERGLFTLALDRFVNNDLEPFIEILLEIPHMAELFPDQAKVHALLFQVKPLVGQAIDYHLIRGNIDTAVHLVKCLNSLEDKKAALFHIAKHLLNENNPKLFCRILLEIPEYGAQFTDQEKVQDYLTFALMSAIKNNEIELASRISSLFPNVAARLNSGLLCSQ